MLENLIIIEDGKEFQCKTERELVELLIAPNYYAVSEKEKYKLLRLKATANILNKKIDIIEYNLLKKDTNISNKFVILDETTYILSLLQLNNVILLEKLGSNIYTQYLNEETFTKNYVIINKFAEKILEKYINNKFEMEV